MGRRRESDDPVSLEFEVKTLFIVAYASLPGAGLGRK